MNTKFDELLEFPCHFPFKVIGHASEQLPDQVVAVVQAHAPGDYHPTVRPSSKGSYHAVTINITATSKEQLETLYTELGAIDGVIRVL
ncbi:MULTISPECIES: DUF493 family protein YbeD [Ferrimonas]|uniref:UPF0250 protein SAMN04488540_104342 n=1 Tax=Ferrimonas sediminum TaxID=718193 RepID=A0A1G8QL49_9GAMM|nr:MULTISPECIES: DUF493 family protein YbeD [Ferrimonas]USD38233.1 YbeD family protein [Ferrimonas sp. SCSIO 43195]SDJ05529.1 hypothetical protein SAMN04488540_104342 [Ferrimonas sediminum]